MKCSIRAVGNSLTLRPFSSGLSLNVAEFRERQIYCFACKTVARAVRPGCRRGAASRDNNLAFIACREPSPRSQGDHLSTRCPRAERKLAVIASLALLGRHCPLSPIAQSDPHQQNVIVITPRGGLWPVPDAATGPVSTECHGYHPFRKVRPVSFAPGAARAKSNLAVIACHAMIPGP